MLSWLRRNFFTFWPKSFDIPLRGITPINGFWKDKISFNSWTKGPRPMGSSAMTLGANDFDKGHKVKGQGHVPDSELCVFDLILRIFSVF